MRMRIPIASLALAGALSAAAPSLRPAPDEVLRKNDHEKLGKEIGDYFRALSDQKGINEAFEALGETVDKIEKRLRGPKVLAQVDDWQKAFYLARQASYDDRDVRKGKVDQREIESDFGDLSFAIWVPSQYTTRKDPYPLVLSIPDEGQAPEAHLASDWTEPSGREAAILIAVSMPADAATWDQLGTADAPGGIRRIMATYGVALDKYAIDMNRVFLSGNGAGARGAFATAASFPHLFAGVIGRGAVPAADPTNFSQLPTHFLSAGAHATAFQERAKELGLENVTLTAEGGEAEIWGWIASQARQPIPDHVVFQPPSPFTASAYWIELSGIDVSENPRVEARVDRAANAIDVKAEKVATVQIYFNDRLVDLSKPVQVTINGTKHEIEVPRNLRVMLDLAYNLGDWGRVFTNRMPFDVGE
jgi:poly(3-hydroxybutyrate) depolymerase